VSSHGLQVGSVVSQRSLGQLLSRRNEDEKATLAFAWKQRVFDTERTNKIASVLFGVSTARIRQKEEQWERWEQKRQALQAEAEANANGHANDNGGGLSTINGWRLRL
jgi:hypothetical protein